MNTISEGWESYSTAVLPNEAQPIQRHESQAAFYAGAKWLMRIMTERLVGMSEPAGEAVLAAIDVELNDFGHRGVFESHAQAVRESQSSTAEVRAEDLGKDADPI